MALSVPQGQGADRGGGPEGGPRADAERQWCRDRRRARAARIRAGAPASACTCRAHISSRASRAWSASDQRVILYCASGNRSAFAAQTMQELLGYEDVASMRGGITLWKDRGYDVEVPRALTPSSASATRATCSSRDRPRGPSLLLDAKVLLLGAGGLGSPAALLPGRGRRGHDRPRRQRRRRPLEPAAPGRSLERPHRRAEGRLGRDLDPRHQSGREGREAPGPARRGQHHGDHRRLRRGRRRTRQLSHALPAERRERAQADPGRVGLDPRLRGPARSSTPTRAPAIAASTRRPRPRSWRRPRRGPACLACFPA